MCIWSHSWYGEFTDTCTLSIIVVLIVNISSSDNSVDEDGPGFFTITVFIVNGIPVAKDVEVEIEYIDGRANGK